MMKTKNSFKKSDLKRSIAASSVHELEVRQAEINTDGTIRLSYGSDQPKMRNEGRGKPLVDLNAPNIKWNRK